MKITNYFLLALLLLHCKITFCQSQIGNKNYGTNNNSINNAMCINGDFELTPAGAYPNNGSAVNGWTITSRTATACNASNSFAAGSPEFSVMLTPIPNVLPLNNNVLNAAPLVNSPLGGNTIIKLNDEVAGALVTRIAQTFPVTSANALFQFAYAALWDIYPAHTCCTQAGLKVNVYDCSGNLLSCPSLTLSPKFPWCMSGVSGYNVFNFTSWTDWQVKYIDLSPYIGTCVTIEIESSDCTDGTHAGTVYFDAICGALSEGCFPLAPLGNTITTSYCVGSSLATLVGPLGYESYQWYSNSCDQLGNCTSVPILSPVDNTYSMSISSFLGATFTLEMTTASGCSVTVIDTIAPSITSIVAIGASSTCATSAIGSATVLATGSPSGYSYIWYDLTNLTPVGTTSVITNLTPGIYSVTVSSLCGTASATVEVGVSTSNFSTVLKPFCSNTAYLSMGSGGTNFQWYNGSSLIPANLGGTASSYTVNNASMGDIYQLSYSNSQGCKDSIKMLLNPTMAGNVDVSYNPPICQNATNGLVVLSMTTALGVYGTNSFSLFSITSSSLLSSTPLQSSSTTYTASGLLANETYSVSAFDGACFYTKTFALNIASESFSLSPETATVCNGNNLSASVLFSNSSTYSQNSYTWTPNTFLLGNLPYSPNTIITPTSALGTVSVMIYTVTVSPSLLYCPISKTLELTIENLPTPTVTPLPIFCVNSPTYGISAGPLGGVFSDYHGAVSADGVITPSLSYHVGPMDFNCNTIFYTISPNGCPKTVASCYSVNPKPLITVTGNNLPICPTSSTTLNVSGADSFQWNTGFVGAIYIVNPAYTTTYIAVGTDSLTGCSSDSLIVVTIMPAPTLSVNGRLLICNGESDTLYAYGADFYYDWGGVLSSSIVVSPSVTTIYTVTGVNTNICYSKKVVTVVVDACTSLQEQITENHELKVYPNPSKGIFTIEANVLGGVFSVYNGLGDIIAKIDNNGSKQIIDLSDCNDGIYILRWNHNNDKTQVVKLIKLR